MRVEKLIECEVAEGKKSWYLYKLSNIFNMAKPLLFVLDDGTTYDAKGSKEIWFTSDKSGLDKRH